MAPRASLRRVDWRFLLPHPPEGAFRHLVLLGGPRDLLNMEGRFPEGTLTELERRGHVINRWAPWNESAGHAHGITVDAETGTLAGGADPRSDGAAIGY